MLFVIGILSLHKGTVSVDHEYCAPWQKPVHYFLNLMMKPMIGLTTQINGGRRMQPWRTVPTLNYGPTTKSKLRLTNAGMEAPNMETLWAYLPCQKYCHYLDRTKKKSSCRRTERTCCWQVINVPNNMTCPLHASMWHGAHVTPGKTPPNMSFARDNFQTNCSFYHPGNTDPIQDNSVWMDRRHQSKCVT